MPHAACRIPHEVRPSVHTSVRLRVVAHQSASRSRASIVSALAPRAPSIDIRSVVYIGTVLASARGRGERGCRRGVWRRRRRARRAGGSAGAGRDGGAPWGWWRRTKPVAHAAAHPAGRRRPRRVPPAGGLEHAAGQLYAALTSQPTHRYQPARLPAGLLPRQHRQSGSGCFEPHTLARRSSKGWSVGRADRRDAAAARLGVAGRLADRARRYTLEREAFAWWTDELVWMHAPRRTAASRRLGLGQFAAGICLRRRKRKSSSPRNRSVSARARKPPRSVTSG